MTLYALPPSVHQCLASSNLSGASLSAFLVLPPARPQLLFYPTPASPVPVLHCVSGCVPRCREPSCAGWMSTECFSSAMSFSLKTATHNLLRLAKWPLLLPVARARPICTWHHRFRRSRPLPNRSGLLCGSLFSSWSGTGHCRSHCLGIGPSQDLQPVLPLLSYTKPVVSSALFFRAASAGTSVYLRSLSNPDTQIGLQSTSQ